jgi:hypothetical protein
VSYSFPCTPCGFDHAGECEVLGCGCKGKCKGGHSVTATAPITIDRSIPDPVYITVQVGTRWRLEHQFPGSTRWQQVGFPDGYEVMAIVGNQAGAAIQMREWKAPHYPIYTCAIGWWDPDGIGASNGGRNRFVAWT